MLTLYQGPGLHITEHYVRAAPGTFTISDIRSAWTTRPTATRAAGLVTATAAIAAVVAVFGLFPRTNTVAWLISHWQWVVAAPGVVLLATVVVLFEPVSLRLESRRHELWIATSAGEVQLWQHNRVEVNKALRAIRRARERQQHAERV